MNWIDNRLSIHGKQTTEPKIKELKENGINFSRYKKHLIIYNNKKEQIITENLLKVIIKIAGKEITLNQLDILYLFAKFEVVVPLGPADYIVAVENDELLKKALNVSEDIEKEILENPSLRMALNYYINNKYSGEVLYNTLRIFHKYGELTNGDIIGFHFFKNLISERCNQLNIPKLKNAGFGGKYTIPHVIIEESDRTIILTNNAHDLSRINGVIYNENINKPVHEIIELGELYDLICSNGRVQYGNKFNTQPDEYELVNPTVFVSTIRLNKTDKQTYDFSPHLMDRGI
jgi:hypothetical protein